MLVESCGISDERRRARRRGAGIGWALQSKDSIARGLGLGWCLCERAERTVHEQALPQARTGSRRGSFSFDAASRRFPHRVSEGLGGRFHWLQCSRSIELQPDVVDLSMAGAAVTHTRGGGCSLGAEERDSQCWPLPMTVPATIDCVGGPSMPSTAKTQVCDIEH